MTIPELLDRYRRTLSTVDQLFDDACAREAKASIEFYSGRRLELRTVIRDLETLLAEDTGDHR